MTRRVLDLVLAFALVGAGVVVAARVAEPSMRPVLYPPSASPSPVLPTPTIPATTAAPTTTAAPGTTTVSPVAAATTTVPLATTTTATVAPVDEEAVLTASYAWGRSTDAVLLQTVLGVEADGWYGPGTREAHLAENAVRGLSVDAVPAPPTTTTTTAGADDYGGSHHYGAAAQHHRGDVWWPGCQSGGSTSGPAVHRRR